MGNARDPTPLRARAYLGEELPPLDAVTSARGVVLRGDEVLVMRNADGLHVLPGGRREAGETLKGTVEREVLEEAGWEVEVGSVLGFIHFLHLEPRPPRFQHPYPEFAQVVYRATALRHMITRSTVGFVPYWRWGDGSTSRRHHLCGSGVGKEALRSSGL